MAMDLSLFASDAFLFRLVLDLGRDVEPVPHLHCTLRLAILTRTCAGTAHRCGPRKPVLPSLWGWA